MSIQIASKSTSNWQASKTSATKPTGLAVGDLMVAVFGINESAPGRTLTAGWTSLRITTNTPSGNGCYLETAYKIADSGDVALSTIEVTTTTHTNAICLFRITNFMATSIFVDNGATLDNTSSPAVFTNTITPAKINSLIIVAFEAQATNSLSSGFGYTIAVSDPTFVEQFHNTDGAGHQFGVAAAVRPQITATGNLSVTGETQVTSDWVAQQISIRPREDLTATLADTQGETDAVTAIRTRVINPSDTQGSSDSVAALVERVWNKTAKTVKSWVFRSKT